MVFTCYDDDIDIWVSSTAAMTMTMTTATSSTTSVASEATMQFQSLTFAGIDFSSLTPAEVWKTS